MPDLGVVVDEEQYYRRLVAFANFLIQPKRAVLDVEAEDLVHDAYVRAATLHPEQRGHWWTLAYMRATVHSFLTQRFEQWGREHAGAQWLDGEVGEGGGLGAVLPDPVDLERLVLDRLELGRVYAAALADPDMAMVVVFARGTRARELAEELDLTEAEVASRVQNARRRYTGKRRATARRTSTLPRRPYGVVLDA